MVFSDEENRFLLDLYEYSDNCPRIARAIAESELDCSIGKSCIPRRWTQAGLQRNLHGGHRNGISKNSFLNSYNKFKRDFQKIRDSLELTPRQLVDLGYRYGVQFSNRPIISSSNGQKDSISRLYGRFDTNGKRINTRGSFLN